MRRTIREGTVKAPPVNTPVGTAAGQQPAATCRSTFYQIRQSPTFHWTQTGPAAVPQPATLPAGEYHRTPLSPPLQGSRVREGAAKQGYLTCGLKRGDLIQACPVPPVVCLEDAQNLLDEVVLDPAAADSADWQSRAAEYVEYYFVAEAENRRALSSTLTSLAGQEGQGFILNGLYGAGKSHFLAVLGLLAARPEAWPLFLQSHPEYAALSRHFLRPATKPMMEAESASIAAGGSLLTVLVPLDAHRGSREDLEDILFGAAEQALLKGYDGPSPGLAAAPFALSLAEETFFPLYREPFESWLAGRMGEEARWEKLRAEEPAAAAGLAAEFARSAGIPLEWQEPRRERLHRLLEVARDRGFRGVVFLLDELSLFLGSKPRDRFHNDVSLLQFLGQQSRHYPLWVVAAVQRGVEEVGDIDADTLRKLKDRYLWDLTLSMAQLRPVIGRKVVRPRDPAGFREFVVALWQTRAEAGAPAGLDPEELEDIYPLHPLSLECLAEASNRFFSKTRSVIQFAAEVAARSECSASELVGPDEVFEHFWPAVQESPELAPTREAYLYYTHHIAEIVPECPDYALRLVRTLAALALAGLRKTVREIASALPPPAELEMAPSSGMTGTLQGAGPVHTVLERLRMGGGYVDAARGESPAADLYFFDAGYSIARTVRRRLAVFAAGLEDDDERVMRAACAAASDASLPLSSLDRPCRVEVDWLTARHIVSVERRDLSRWTVEEAAADLEWLANPEAPETMRLLVGELLDPESQRTGFFDALRQLPADRWRAGLAAWAPRALRDEERRLLRDFAACCLLMEDPTLRSNGLGRQVMERLRAGRAAQDAEARTVVRKAYAEGELWNAAGTIATGRDLGSHASRLEEVASLAAGRVLPDLFPDFLSAAPRRRVGGRAVVGTLVNELILPGSAPVRPGSAVDGLIRDIAIPLGIAAGQDGRYLLCDPPPRLLDAILGAVPEGEPTRWKTAAGMLAKSTFGLTGEMIDLLAAVMVRRGHLSAVGANGLPAPLSGAPLSVSAKSLQRGDTLAAGLWARLETLGEALGAPVTARDLPAQEQLWERLQSLRAGRDTAALRDQLLALAPDLGGVERWAESLRLLDEWDAWLESLPMEMGSAAGLRAALDATAVGQEGEAGVLYHAWQSLRQFAAEEGPSLVRAVRYMLQPGFTLTEGSDLGVRAGRLLGAVGEGECILGRSAEAARYAASLLERYREEYLNWHLAANGERRFGRYRRLPEMAGWRALDALERLPLSAPPALGEIATRMEAELSRQCSSAGLAGALLRSPVCPTCRLPPGSTVDLLAIDELEGQLIAALSGRLGALALPENLERLRRHHPRLGVSTPLGAAYGKLLEMITETEGTPGRSESERAALDGLLEETLVREIRKALSVGEPVARSLRTLGRILGGREMARTDAARLFVAWIDPEGRMGPEEIVRFED